MLLIKLSTPTYITKERKMIHTTPARTTMQFSKPKANRLTDHTCTPKQGLVFIITFFTLLRAAWLLHPSQIEPLSFVDDYYPTPSLASTMTRVTSKTLKGSSTFDSLASKHKPKNRKTRGGNTIFLLLQVPSN